jgi:hypothetical protein
MTELQYDLFRMSNINWYEISKMDDNRCLEILKRIEKLDNLTNKGV